MENLFFTFFAVTGLVSLWVPVLFFVRGTLTDFLRGLASRAGRSGFGRASMLETGWGQRLVSSHGSRAAYAVLKCICFCYLGLLMPLVHTHVKWLDTATWARLMWAGRALVAATVIFCLVRALPVIWEGRRYWNAALDEKRPAAAVAVAEHVR